MDFLAKMRTLDYYKVYRCSTTEIKNELVDMINEIKEYLSTDDDLTPSFIKMMNDDIFDLEHNINVILNFKEMDIELIEYEDINNLINAAIELNMNINFLVKKGEYNDPNLEDSVDLLFKDQTIEKFEEINNFLKNKNIDELIFIESDMLDEVRWNIEQIKNANRRVNGVVNHIKTQNFTPFEAICFIHKMITSNFQYQENEDEPTLCRSLIGVLNTSNIVCVGYSLLVKAIVDKLNNPNLKSDTSVIQLEQDKDNCVSDYLNAGDGHMQNVIFIEDEKYDIHGVYLVDTTFDSKSKNFPSGKGVANFMFPVMDILNYTDTKVLQYDNNLDEMLGMLGIEYNCPEIPPIIKKYKERSNPIELGNIINCMKAAYKYFYNIKDEQSLENRIEYTLDVSMMVSQNIFTSNAINTIRVEAEKYEFEF